MLPLCLLTVLPFPGARSRALDRAIFRGNFKTSSVSAFKPAMQRFRSSAAQSVRPRGQLLGVLGDLGGLKEPGWWCSRARILASRSFFAGFTDGLIPQIQVVAATR